MTRFAPLAGKNWKDWIQAVGVEPIAPNEAVDDQDAAGAVFLRIADGSSKQVSGALRKVESVVLSTPWLLFCYFTGLPGAVSRKLAGAVLDLLADQNDTGNIPWGGRTDAFLDSCRQIEDADLGLKILAQALKVLDDPPIRALFLERLNDDGLKLVGDLPPSIEKQLREHADKLSPALKAAIGRGRINRIVMDGSNVAFGGRARGYGARAKLGYVLEARQSLAEAGFCDIVLYFDPMTRHDMSESDARRMAQMATRGEAIICGQGKADPHIIRAFMSEPKRSWILTNDRYRQHATEVPGFLDWWPRKALLTFHIDQHERVIFDRPLDRPLIEASA